MQYSESLNTETVNAWSYKPDDLFQLVRTQVIRHGKPCNYTKANLSLTIGVYEFAIIQQGRGVGIVQVSEPSTGVVWASELLHGADRCVQRVIDAEGNDQTAPWLDTLLRYVLNVPLKAQRVTQVFRVRSFEGKGVSVCV